MVTHGTLRTTAKRPNPRRSTPSQWNGTPGKIHPQINGNIKRSRSRSAVPMNTLEAADLLSNIHPGLMTKMLSLHPPPSTSKKRTAISPRRKDTTKRVDKVDKPTQTSQAKSHYPNPTIPHENPDRTPSSPLSPNLDNKLDDKLNDTLDDLDDSMSDQDDDALLEEDLDALNLPLSPGLMTRLFQAHSPPSSTCRKIVQRANRRTTSSKKLKHQPGLVTSLLNNHPHESRSQRRCVTSRNAQSIPSAHRPHSARRTYHNKHSSKHSSNNSNNSMLAPREHCLPGYSHSSSPPVQEFLFGGRKRTSLQISMLRSENHAQRLHLTQSIPPSRPSFLETKVGSLLISPVGKCQMRLMLHMENRVGEPTMTTRRGAAGEDSPGKRERGSKIKRSEHKKKNESKVVVARKQQEKSRERILYRARVRGDIDF